MARGFKASFLGLLVLASGASATTLGGIKGTPVVGRPLEVNIPFAVDRAADRACASAKVHYGKVLVPGATLDVQGQGLQRNLLVTSRTVVNKEPVTVQVRVGCGPKAVTRTFTLPTNPRTANGLPVTELRTRQAASDLARMSGPRSIASPAPREPLFPRPSEAAARESSADAAESSAAVELRNARTQAAAVMAQLDATRRELAAVLDVERRTSQTLIDAEHEIGDAKSQLARLRVMLGLVGTALALAAAGVIWLGFNRVALGRRTSEAPPAREPVFRTGPGWPTQGQPLLASGQRKEAASAAAAAGPTQAMASGVPEWLRADSLAASADRPPDATASGPPQRLRAASTAAAAGGPTDVTASGLPEWLRAASIAAAAGDPIEATASRTPEWPGADVISVAGGAGAS